MICVLFTSYLTERYNYLSYLLNNKIPDKEVANEILHFTIDYFYTKYSKEKLDKIIIETGQKGMDSYIIKSLYTNYSSDTAPYRQTYHKNGTTDKFEYPFENVNWEEVDEQIAYEPDEVDYISDLILRLIHTEYVKEQFSSIEHWEYSRKIFHLHLIEGVSYKELSNKTQIKDSTLRYNFIKLKDILHDIVTNEQLMLDILPQGSVQKIYKNVNEKLIKYWMDYYEQLEQYQKTLPKQSILLLRKCASQKVKKNLDGTPRDKVCIMIDIMDHLERCKGIVSSRVLNIERIGLISEWIGKQTPYNKPGCGSCMDQVTKGIMNILHNKDNQKLLSEWNESKTT